VLSAFLSGALLVALFLFIIPQIGSLEDVWTSITSMSWETVALLLVAALAIRGLLAAAYPPLIPGLSFFKSLIARESSSAVSNVIPGPSGTATQYVVLRSWGVSTERFAGATVGVSVITDALVFAAPGLFFVLWVLLGMPAETGTHNLWVVGSIALVVTAVTLALVIGIARSEPLARLVGRVGQRCVNPFRRLFGKPRITTWPDQASRIRADTLQQVRGNATVLSVCIGGGYLLNGLLLVACLWACGVEKALMPMSMGLFLYAVGRLATIVPITPGAIGVAEVAYTAVYMTVLGDEDQSAVVAGVLVYRALTYALPLVTGAIAYVIWRVMRHKEIKELARADATPG
jgi:putative heme transporter